tara:strand:+ start:492 stop:659 length:168 start_codon:yes stop_codon:yes gene_type:complete
MTKPEDKKGDNKEVAKYKRLLDLTLKHQKRSGEIPYGHYDRYDEILETKNVERKS